MADLKPLTPVQEVMLIQYHLARIAWETGDWTGYDNPDGIAYTAALDACLAAGFDPFHYPASL
jgi:hypothetical protein